jgi:predicted metal-binding protein
MTTKNQIEKYIKQAVKFGALDARQVSTKTIITAPWVRIKCQYGCSGYGKRLTCPPYSPTPGKTERMLMDYQTAILIRGDDHSDVTSIAAKLERRIFLDGYYKAFAMGSGPCRLCDECNMEEGECLNPYEARPAMEACGIDVFKTARSNGFPIEVVKNRKCEQNYYSIVLIE